MSVILNVAIYLTINYYHPFAASVP